MERCEVTPRNTTTTKKQEKDGELEAGCRMKRWGGAD